MHGAPAYLDAQIVQQLAKFILCFMLTPLNLVENEKSRQGNAGWGGTQTEGIHIALENLFKVRFENFEHTVDIVQMLLGNVHLATSDS